MDLIGNPDMDAEFEGDLEYDDEPVLQEMETIINDLFSYYVEWTTTREESIQKTRLMVQDLHACQRRTDVAKLAGATVGAVSTLLSVVPLRRKSRVLQAVGTAAGVVGAFCALTDICATYVRNSTEIRKWEELLEILERDKDATEAMRDIMNKSHTALKSLHSTGPGEHYNLSQKIFQTVRGAKTVVKRLPRNILRSTLSKGTRLMRHPVKYGIKMSSVFLGTKSVIRISHVLKGFNVFLASIFILMDLVYSIQVVQNIQNGSQNEVANKMTEIVDFMTSELEIVKDYITQIQLQDTDLNYDEYCENISDGSDSSGQEDIEEENDNRWRHLENSDLSVHTRCPNGSHDTDCTEIEDVSNFESIQDIDKTFYMITTDYVE